MNHQPKYVTPQISKEEAGNILSNRTSFLPIRIRKRRIRPKRIELLHLPFYLFEILPIGGAGNQRAIISVDGLLGSIMFLAEESLDYLPRIENPACGFVLSPAEAQKIATEEYKWLRLKARLRNKGVLSRDRISEVEMIFYPFWVAYFRNGEGYDFRTIDAVSGEVQDMKMRKVFLKAFRQLG